MFHVHIQSKLLCMPVMGTGTGLSVWDRITLSWSGQVRSECLTCTFKASCCSAHLSLAQVQASLSGTGIEMGEGLRGDDLHWQVQESTSSPTVSTPTVSSQ